MHDFSAWANFYVITGSSAAALTGLMFVVITLVAGLERGSNPDGVHTYSSPTVVHFCSALLLAAILSAPWHSLGAPAVILFLSACVGIAYALRITLRMLQMQRRSTPGYTAGLDDWLFYALAPLCIHTGIAVCAVLLPFSPRYVLFVLAAWIMALIFLGIRNAWDTVTYIAVFDRAAERE